MIPMMNMMVRPVEKVKAVRTWNQPEYADRGEPTHVNGKSLKDSALKGRYFRGVDGKLIKNVDSYADADPVDVLWPDWWDLGLFFRDNICFAYLGVETTRPSTANGGYEYHKKYHVPDQGRWQHLYFATQLKEYRPYRAATGSNRVIDIHEVDGACTLTMIDPVDGNTETLSATMLTDMDDVANRPTCQTGTVAMHHGTIDTTQNMTLRLAGHINEPLSEVLKVGGSTSQSYDPTGVQSRWSDGKTWTVPYISQCHKYGTNYYEISYSENGETLLDLEPYYDGLTQQACFVDRANSNRMIFSQGERPFKAVRETDPYCVEV